jgi:hypothetical protein
MRTMLLLLLLSLAACSGDPRAYGITGARPAKPPPAPGEESSIGGAPDTGTVYGPTNGPTTGGGQFWGYN